MSAHRVDRRTLLSRASVAGAALVSASRWHSSAAAAPAAAAWMVFLEVFSRLVLTEPLVSGWPISGMRIFARISAAGAAIRLAPSRCSANRSWATSNSSPCTAANGPPRKTM